MNPKGPTSRYITIKWSKVKGREKILKVAEENKLLHASKTISGFFNQNLAGHRERTNIFRVLKEKKPIANHE